MSEKGHPNEKNVVDTLTAFFQDVARIPIVGSRNEYLPLTRRIHRGMLLLRLQGETSAHTYEKVASALNQTLNRLNGICEELGHQGIELQLMAFEIEPFFDDPDQDDTPSIAQLLEVFQKCKKEDRERIKELVWRCFYLVSLLPIGQRSQFPEIIYNDDIEEHFVQITRETEDARERLIQGTLRYSISIARLFIDHGLPYLDLVQEGNLGLIRATRSYNERRGHFQPYAGQWIRQRITRFIADTCSTIRVPVHVHEKTGQIETAWQEFAALNGRPPNEMELFEALGWLSSAVDEEDSNEFDQSSENIEQLENTIYVEKTRLSKARRKLEHYWTIALPPYSLDCPEIELSGFDEDEQQGDTVTISDVLVDQVDLEHLVEHNILREAIFDTIQPNLKEREFEILQMRYGLYDGVEHTLEEVGQRFGVSRERIRQIESSAFRKLSCYPGKIEVAELAEFLI
jgi:RNA polymerase sigma factor (sigma-70 family)